jgi:hypothetical protein
LSTKLATRKGLPEDLRFLLGRYPREAWSGHANLGEMARFWLARHAMFRELGSGLQDATKQFREGVVQPREFQAWFAPRLQFFLSQLHTHHHVEDRHYFPIFRTAEERLAPGFDVLESDHEVLHQTIMKSVESANEFLRSMQAAEDARRFAGDRYADVSDELLRHLLRHLEDEEDLIVPLILDRGEQKLGVA